MKRSNWTLLMLVALVLLALAPAAMAAPVGGLSPHDILNSVDLRAPLQSPGLSTPLQLILLLAALTLLPFLVIMTTSFVRTVIVLAFLKQAMGLQNIPPGQVIIGMALFLTLFTMTPTWNQINHNAIVPFLNNQISQETMLSTAAQPLEAFMVRQTDQQELSFFIGLAKAPAPKTPADVPFQVAVPAFMVSEVATGFKIGFIIYLPFILVDIVVTNVIMILGMQQLQTQMIAPPFKVLIFSLANGWHLVIEALVKSFH
ncbi:MAG TPA: flagellar type III secretion system pore protein FliP [Oscillatoriaceae cyanobacterium]